MSGFPLIPGIQSFHLHFITQTLEKLVEKLPDLKVLSLLLCSHQLMSCQQRTPKTLAFALDELQPLYPTEHVRLSSAIFFVGDECSIHLYTVCSTEVHT